MNQERAFHALPLAILIFDNNGEHVYRAYSPNNFHVLADGAFPNERDEQYGRFLANIFQRVAINHPNNNRPFGVLIDVHLRWTNEPLENQGNTVYFFTFQHPQYDYRPICRNSQVYSRQNDAQAYGNANPMLAMASAHYEFV